MKTKISRLRLVAVSAMVGLLMAGCAAESDPSPEKKPPVKIVEMTVGYPSPAINASYAFLAVAELEGYYEEEGLKVKIQPTGGSVDAVQNVIGGQFQAAFAPPEAIIPMINEDHDLVMAYNLVRSATMSIAVLSDSPVKSIADFKGKRLGAQSLGSGNIRLATGMLQKAGLKETDVEYLAVGVGAQALQALKSNEVAGLVLFDSIYATMENLGAELRYFDPDSYLMSSQLAVKGSTVKESKSMIEGFGKAVAKASYYSMINPEAAVRAMWKVWPETRTAATPEAQQLKDDIKILQRRLNLMTTGGVEKSMKWGSYDDKAVEQWIGFAASTGMIGSKPTAKTFTSAFEAAFNDWDSKAIETKAKAAK